MGREPADIATDNHSLAVAAVCLDINLRGTAAAAEQERRLGLNFILDRIDSAVILSAPPDRRLKLATTAREHCHGRFRAVNRQKLRDEVARILD